jgi:hypothetical protein
MTRSAPLLVALALAGCNNADVPQDARRERRADLAVADLPTDFSAERATSLCDPGCHWDCFLGATCTNGEVQEFGSGAIPCCKHSDPWPLPGPPCFAGVLLTCPSGCATSIDRRYEQCIKPPHVQGSRWTEPPVVRMLCAGFRPARLGDPCAKNDDCRPAHESMATGLACDLATSTCVAAPRPAPAHGFGESCGLNAADVATTISDAVRKYEPKMRCAICHVYRDVAAGCLRQGCTQECTFDEDCPQGTICSCAGGSTFGSVCMATTHRTTAAGRTEGLKCTASLVDAGVKDAGSTH